MNLFEELCVLSFQNFNKTWLYFSQKVLITEYILKFVDEEVEELKEMKKMLLGLETKMKYTYEILPE